MSSKLSTLVNEMAKMKETVYDVHRKQDGHATQIAHSHEELKGHVQLVGKGGGVSWLVFAASQLVWAAVVAYLLYGGGRGLGRGGGGLLGGDVYSGKRNV